MTPMEARCAQYRNKLKPDPFATIVPSRRPEVKYHSGLGRAKAAVSHAGGWSMGGNARGGEIYERTADGWSLLFRVEAGTPAVELPWRESR
ncbi:hypothetical protein ABZ446_28570 [Streptomyces sp. NPDC005813]|uniref:hypothetical protein n=1 Tax=Streptomyces sp. NPDC005813 TaxID=3155592 RepID=UPI0033D8E5BF